MPHDPYKALYLHIPFCKSRCNYCDFTSQAIPSESPLIDEYVEYLIREIRKAAKEGELASVQTVYLGGGTPTHIGSSRLTALLYAISISLDLSKEGFEFTLEANPESLDARLVRDLWAMGANRLSLGVQSLDDDLLRLLGRPHDAQQAMGAIDTAHERFENVSVDVMCGIPGQSEESLAKTLESVIEHGVTHVSVYPLAIERRTPFDRMVLSGELEEVDEDAQADHMVLAQDLLQAAGFIRYEVASYARPGFECRHNISYWTGVPYLGIGRGAATMTQNSERRMRVCDNEVTDDLNRAEMEAEDLMLGMRLARGISHERLQEASIWLPEAIACFESLVQEGYLAYEDGRFAPTQLGWLCGNELYGRLYDLA